jgi:D-3-phosphoglycerate dehydrogenase / 2-oxoglutarate reductase
MRILIADQFEQSGRDALARLGCEVRFAPKLKDEALAVDVEQFRPDVLVVRSTKVPEAVLASGALKLVVRAGAGYNTIDVAAASRRGAASTSPTARARIPLPWPNWPSV